MDFHQDVMLRIREEILMQEQFEAGLEQAGADLYRPILPQSMMLDDSLGHEAPDRVASPVFNA